MTKSKMTTNLFDAIIFGSGLSGLACARKMALSGKSVCVIERSDQLGGHLPSFERKGVRFEVGIHYIAATDPGNLFAKACSEIKLSPEIIPLDTAFEKMHNEGLGVSFQMRSPFHLYIQDLIRDFPEQEKPLKQFEQDANDLWAIANKLSFPFTKINLIVALFRSRNRIRLLRIATSSLKHYLKNILQLPPPAIEIISLQHLLIGVNPKQLSAAIYLLVHRYYFEKPCFIKGGGDFFTKSLLHPSVSYVTGENAKIYRNRKKENGRFRIETAQGDIFAHNVVWTPDPRLFQESSNISLGTIKNIQLSRVKEPHALVIAYFATTQPLNEVGMENCNHWLMGTLNSENCYGEETASVNPTDWASRAPLYVSTGSLRDPLAITTSHSQGAQGVFQAMFLLPTKAEIWGVSDSKKYKVSESRGGHAETYRSHKTMVLAAIKKRLINEFPLLETTLCWEDLATPLTHERYLFSRSRNGYGYAPTVADFILWRPSYKTPVPGLYLCGAHIKPAHGIATTLLNGVGLGSILSE